MSKARKAIEILLVDKQQELIDFCAEN